jgi:flavodoxin
MPAVVCEPGARALVHSASSVFELLPVQAVREKSMPRALVVYFSRTGYTRKIAEDIAARCGADIEGIQDVRDRSGMWGYLRSAREALGKRLIDIRPPIRNPSDYNVVILGTPVWASNICSPMRAYVTTHREEFRQVAFFCTQGGSGAKKVLDDMAKLCKHRPVASLALNDEEIKRGLHAEKLNQFLAVVALPKAA